MFNSHFIGRKKRRWREISERLKFQDTNPPLPAQWIRRTPWLFHFSSRAWRKTDVSRDGLIENSEAFGSKSETVESSSKLLGPCYHELRSESFEPPHADCRNMRVSFRLCVNKLLNRSYTEGVRSRWRKSPRVYFYIIHWEREVFFFLLLLIIYACCTCI